jgi:hypothetical protein
MSERCNIGIASHQFIVVATSFINSGPTKVLVVMRAPAATMLAGPTKLNPGQALSALESLRPQQGEDQVKQQAGSDEGGE